MEGSLKNQVALVTGSARGIGFACAKSLAKRGAAVVLADILDCGEAKQQLESEFPGIRVLALQVDVRDRAQVEQAIHETVEEFGGIDIVVNNAGTVSRLNLKDMTDEDWSRDIETNLRGTFLFTQAAIYPHMVNQGSGRVINISSISGMMGGAISYGEDGERQGRSGPAYAASKGGIIAFTKLVAKEVGEFGITVNSVAPGPVETAITKGVNYPLELQSIKRPGQPEDIGEAVAYLASPSASYVTGEVLKVCGGAGIGA
ncbi:SDR family NAD(P)-dependent oxidoreductase [Planococcus maitriensis]|uniref:3-oxoacyl-ACP reductase n=1 Tax=Planococcus maitriensis TaxID=221799 RepID=A0A365K1H4_9BACL|nr:SDR family NAD(P)-dependent oxidoreductase [Planococcus maitriensis]RAZ66503.1 3-oxoacyl-ACP reductase [Planococcus maitriensis]